jgi:hypothetical protein
MLRLVKTWNSLWVQKQLDHLFQINNVLFQSVDLHQVLVVLAVCELHLCSNLSDNLIASRDLVCVVVNVSGLLLFLQL